MTQELRVEDLYVLKDPLGSRAFRGRVVSDVETYALTRGESRPRDPVVVKHDQGGTLYDVIWTTNVAPLIVSTRVVELLETNKVSGWGSYDVELIAKSGERVDGYVGLSINGRCGPIRDELSPVVDAIYPGRRTQRHLGWYFDTKSWDGSDMFVPSDGSVVVFITDPVRRILDKGKVGNLSLRRASEVRRILLPK